MGYICGFYYTIPVHSQWHIAYQKHYLPQVELKAHTTVLSTTSRTKLTQAFINPSDKGIKQLRYTFPLYNGVSVVGFTCHVGDRVIEGVVKEKEKARAVYQEAVDRGETAGLLEQLPDASDVFTTTVGNVPAGAKIVVEITYLGELKHDAEVDGIRFTIPTSISPRYGTYPGELARAGGSPAQSNGGMQITVDAIVSEGSFIRKLQSPSHPIAVSMGTTSTAPDEDPQMTKASATLTLGSCELEKDFILQIVAKDTGVPKAMLETHPALPHHRALLATLVPKFSLPAAKPEIVFVCDRSGSMGGRKMPAAVSALKIFLKSLPIGVKFNICSFGSSHSFLWPKSQSYSQSTLDEAVRHVEIFQANYGGTEMYAPLMATIERRFKDMSLEVMLLTDGEIWDQDQLFTYLNKEVNQSTAPIRVFTLGVGNSVSHALIEGVARAGNGFSQAMGEEEKLDTKVVRMLKGALSPHVNDYTIEIVYGKGLDTEAPGNADTDTDEEDFEIIEKVSDCLRVKLDLSREAPQEEKPLAAPKPISLFDTSVDLDKDEPMPADHDGQARYKHLPHISVPKLLQAPHRIPPLFPFIRTSIYLLMSPDTEQKHPPKSVILRGTSQHGPLELEIPVQVLEQPGQTIHQLAAREAIRELEDGRGWLTEAKCEDGTLLKDKYPGRFEEMVEREAVRLGLQYQVGGKWCSFVAVEANSKAKDRDGDETMAEHVGYLDDDQRADEYSSINSPSAATSPQNYKYSSLSRMSLNVDRRYVGHAPSVLESSQSEARRGPQKQLLAMSQAPAQSGSALFGGSASAFGSFGAQQQQQQQSQQQSLQGTSAQAIERGSVLGRRKSSGRDQVLSARSPPPPASQLGYSLFGSSASPTSSGGLFSAAAPSYDRTPALAGRSLDIESQDDNADQIREIVARVAERGEKLEGAAMRSREAQKAGMEDVWASRGARYFSMGSKKSPRAQMASRAEAVQDRSRTTGDKARDLIELQTFEGFWEWMPELLSVLGVTEERMAEMWTRVGWMDRRTFATLTVVAFFEGKLGDERDVWELVVGKARAWLEGEMEEIGDGKTTVEEVLEKVKGWIE
ncbi:hypothetical protein W97_07991 [Coniosporium apollinis CBS 100218]|uniref:VIT domain-containing protein n=1 Tax=Coniosporium apollinis (strain CBS 100218) TaxID=1168221 RepID=R7Z3R2_CONA1|nr:uncharacterized protein W97_07991 [Coniosporium apollinis CBS 100218]EON68733.1 hypothetical protein W97_07991 [Coniosporium apollinis CBS 100218]